MTDIKVRDEIQATDKLHTFKQWFNGLKHFFSVKVSPEQKIKGD